MGVMPEGAEDLGKIVGLVADAAPDPGHEAGPGGLYRGFAVITDKDLSAGFADPDHLCNDLLGFDFNAADGVGFKDGIEGVVRVGDVVEAGKFEFARRDLAPGFGDHAFGVIGAAAFQTF